MSGSSASFSALTLVDMYYEIEPDTDGTFAIANQSDVLGTILSVTNLKVTGPDHVTVTLEDLNPKATVLSAPTSCFIFFIPFAFVALELKTSKK